MNEYKCALQINSQASYHKNNLVNCLYLFWVIYFNFVFQNGYIYDNSTLIYLILQQLLRLYDMVLFPQLIYSTVSEMLSLYSGPYTNRCVTILIVNNIVIRHTALAGIIIA